MADRGLEDLWSATQERPRSTHHKLEQLPDPARRYLRHALTLGAPQPRAVRLRMHGEIRLGARWDRFEGEQVIRAGRGFVWRASIRMRGMRVSGSDRWIDGAGLLSWKLFGLVRLARADGPDGRRREPERSIVEK